MTPPNERLRHTASGRERVPTLHDEPVCTGCPAVSDLRVEVGRLRGAVDTLTPLVEALVNGQRQPQRRMSGMLSAAPRAGEIDINLKDKRVRGGTWAILSAVVVLTIGGCTALIGRAYVSRELGQATAGK